MSYSYAEQKPWLLTDEGQRKFLRVRDQANKLTQLAGACTVIKALETYGSGESWQMLACVDRLVELEEFRYVESTEHFSSQYRIIIKS